jgi:uncharacterized protein YndB with AHSA1/START domain
MALKNDLLTPIEDRDIVITRLLNAPRELVFDAWTKPEHVVNWWGPNGFTTTIHEMDARPGGIWRFIMHGPDGVDWPNLIEFHEVVKPERLVYTHGSGEPSDPHKFEVMITFEAQGSKTALIMRSRFPSKEARDFVVREVNAIEAGNQTINHLEEYLLKMAQ